MCALVSNVFWLVECNNEHLEEILTAIPWSPTSVFPHPLVDIKSSNAKRGLTHYLTYALTDQMTWLG